VSGTEGTTPPTRRCLRGVFDGANLSGSEYNPSEQEDSDGDDSDEAEDCASVESNSIRDVVDTEEAEEDSPSIDGTARLYQTRLRYT
jgi:hypothetical protein